MRRFVTSTLLLAIGVTFGGCDGAPAQWPYPLLSASYYGDLAAVESLLNEPNADINTVGSHRQIRGPGGTALVAAATGNQVAVVKLLLRRGADPNAAQSRSLTPLGVAADNGNLEIARLLICGGADVNLAEARHLYAPLAYAARHGHVEMIKLLIDAGADRNSRDINGGTPYQLAIGYGYPDAAEALVWYRPFTKPKVAQRLRDR